MMPARVALRGIRMDERDQHSLGQFPPPRGLVHWRPGAAPLRARSSVLPMPLSAREIALANPFLRRARAADAPAGAVSGHRYQPFQPVPLASLEPDARKLALLPAEVWLRLRAFPVSHAGPDAVIALSRQEDFAAVQRALPEDGTPLVPVLCDGDGIAALLAQHYRSELACAPAPGLSNR
jgi:hypothetical protein